MLKELQRHQEAIAATETTSSEPIHNENEATSSEPIHSDSEATSNKIADYKNA